MKIIKILSFVLNIFLGLFFVVYGEGDDSPGAQFIGLIAVVVGVVGFAGLIKSRKKLSENKN